VPTEEGKTRSFSCQRIPINWSETAGMAEIGTLGGDCSEPMAINNLGQVIGLSETTALENRPFIWSRELGFRELPILGNVIPRDINNHSEIILDIETPLGMRSFLWVDADKLIQQLPWYERHNTQAFCINDNREIAGQIFGNDGHSHAIIWKVES
jgi:probable HAF family extracellular repeat protein